MLVLLKRCLIHLSGKLLCSLRMEYGGWLVPKALLVTVCHRAGLGVSR